MNSFVRGTFWYVVRKARARSSVCTLTPYAQARQQARMDDPPPKSSASPPPAAMTTARSTTESSTGKSPPSPKPAAPPLSPASSTSTVAQEAPGDLQAVQGVNAPQQQHEQRYCDDDVRCCYGMRAYDGGYYDVGIFFVFHDSNYGDEPGDTTVKRRDRRADASAPKSDAGGDAPSEVDTAQGAAANDNSNLNPFGYQFVDGLKVVAAAGAKEEQVVSGQESGVAMQAYVQLEKQVRRGMQISRHRTTQRVLIISTTDRNLLRGYQRLQNTFITWTKKNRSAVSTVTFPCDSKRCPRGREGTVLRMSTLLVYAAWNGFPITDGSV